MTNGCEKFGEGFLGKLNIWAKENCVPFSTSFELTPFCNFRCVMCYVRLDKEQAEQQGRLLSASEWLEIAKDLRDMGTLQIDLTGGEVFVYPEFWELYSELNRMGFLIAVLSNGSLIDESVMEKFRLYGMPHSVKLTLYGASDDTYVRVCGSSDGFSKISKAIDLLQSAGVPVTMSATVVRENADDLQAMYRFAAEKGIRLHHSVAVLKPSRGAVNTAESSRLGFLDYSYEYTLEDLENSRYRIPEYPFSMCAGYRKSLFITWNGHLQLCSFMSRPYVEYSGDIKADFSKLYGLLEQIKNPPECVACEWKEFCQRCPAVLCCESGHPEKIDKNFCETAKQLKLLYDMKRGINYEE